MAALTCPKCGTTLVPAVKWAGSRRLEDAEFDRVASETVLQAITCWLSAAAGDAEPIGQFVDQLDIEIAPEDRRPSRRPGRSTGLGP